MAELVKPTRSDMQYHKLLHTNPRTMSYQGHIDEISEADLNRLFEQVVEKEDSKHLYRLVYCDDCMDFVSETTWDYCENLDGYVWNAIVRYDLRRVGYGHESLRLMKEEAKKYGIHRFYTYVDTENDAAKMFLKFEDFSYVKEGLYQVEF